MRKARLPITQDFKARVFIPRRRSLTLNFRRIHWFRFEFLNPIRGADTDWRL